MLVIEPRFVCKACGKPGAHVRPDFNWNWQPSAMMQRFEGWSRDASDACKIVEIGAIGASDPIAISDIAVRQLGAFIADRKNQPSRGEITPRQSQMETTRRLGSRLSGAS
jgi:hypothetical protein